MATKITHDRWVWFGNAGHLIVSSNCRFHLCTKIGEYLISTVGEYVPDTDIREILADSRGIKLIGKGDERLHDWMKKVGYEDIGADRKYETMVFVAGPPCTAESCNCLIPAINGRELDFEGYNDREQSWKGHMAMCNKWSSADAPTEKQRRGED